MAPTIESPLPTMAPTATPKGMSSRLMTMKFMQRGEASAKSSPSTTPKTESGGSAKRLKTGHAATPEAKPLYDEAAVKAALDEEESKRQAAIAQRAKELGDEQWVMSSAAISAPMTKQAGKLNFVQVGFAQIDSGFPSDDESKTAGGLAGRRQFNMKKAKKRPAQPESASDSSDSDAESGCEDSSADEEDAADNRGRQAEGTPSGNRKRHSHSVSKRREAERLKAAELAEKRRKKEVKLNTLTTLSSGGAKSAAFGKSQDFSSMKCFSCGETGHSKTKCPNRRKSGS